MFRFALCLLSFASTVDNLSLYSILGVEDDCTAQEIRNAYRNLTRQLHPDQQDISSAETVERYEEVKLAYRILSDPLKRCIYHHYNDLELLQKMDMNSLHLPNHHRTEIPQRSVDNFVQWRLLTRAHLRRRINYLLDVAHRPYAYAIKPELSLLHRALAFPLRLFFSETTLIRYFLFTRSFILGEFLDRLILNGMLQNPKYASSVLFSPENTRRRPLDCPIDFRNPDFVAEELVSHQLHYELEREMSQETPFLPTFNTSAYYYDDRDLLSDGRLRLILVDYIPSGLSRFIKTRVLYPLLGKALRKDAPFVDEKSSRVGTIADVFVLGPTFSTTDEHFLSDAASINFKHLTRVRHHTAPWEYWDTLRPYAAPPPILIAMIGRKVISTLWDAQQDWGLQTSAEAESSNDRNRKLLAQVLFSKMLELEREISEQQFVSALSRAVVEKWVEDIHSYAVRLAAAQQIYVRFPGSTSTGPFWWLLLSPMDLCPFRLRNVQDLKQLLENTGTEGPVVLVQRDLAGAEVAYETLLGAFGSSIVLAVDVASNPSVLQQWAEKCKANRDDDALPQAYTQTNLYRAAVVMWPTHVTEGVSFCQLQLSVFEGFKQSSDLVHFVQQRLYRSAHWPALNPQTFHDIVTLDHSSFLSDSTRRGNSELAHVRGRWARADASSPSLHYRGLYFDKATVAICEIILSQQLISDEFQQVIHQYNQQQLRATSSQQPEQQPSQAFMVKDKAYLVLPCVLDAREGHPFSQYPRENLLKQHTDDDEVKWKRAYLWIDRTDKLRWRVSTEHLDTSEDLRHELEQFLQSQRHDQPLSVMFFARRGHNDVMPFDLRLWLWCSETWKKMRERLPFIPAILQLLAFSTVIVEFKRLCRRLFY